MLARRVIILLALPLEIRRDEGIELPHPGLARANVRRFSGTG
jgi:hypothetical protein